MVCSGLSEVIGSWKIMEILLPLILRNAACGSDSRFAPVNRILPEGAVAGGVRGGRVGEKLEDRQCRHRLARAGFADERHGLGVADVKRHVLDGMRDPLARAEIHRQDLDRGGGGWRPSLALT